MSVEGPGASTRLDEVITRITGRWDETATGGRSPTLQPSRLAVSLPTARDVVWNDLGGFEQESLGQGDDAEHAGQDVGFGVHPGNLPGSHVVNKGNAPPRDPEAGPPPSWDQSLVFRTRAVFISGLLDLGVGLGIVGTGASLLLGGHDSDRTALSIAVGLLGVVVAAVGVSRMTARLEVHHDKLVWTWTFSRFELPFDNLTEASLIEPGSPASGGEFATVVSGGLVAVVAWWVLDQIGSVFNTGPTLGARSLIVLRHHGGPVRIPPIGTFSLQPGSSKAFAAQQAVQGAIDAYRVQRGDFDTTRRHF